jgi:hypothetical protein
VNNLIEQLKKAGLITDADIQRVRVEKQPRPRDEPEKHEAALPARKSVPATGFGSKREGNA